MKVPTKVLRQIIAVLVGVPVLVIGIILIPVPGPGLLVCFLGLLILSSEFDSLKPHRDRAKAQLKKITDKAKEQRDKLNNSK